MRGLRRIETTCYTTPREGMGAEGDWVEFWWNMHDGTYSTLSVGDVFHIYADANPEDWEYYDPYTKLVVSAVAHNVGYSTWNTCAIQAGVKHPN